MRLEAARAAFYPAGKGRGRLLLGHSCRLWERGHILIWEFPLFPSSGASL
jgi:hypothetical protein